MNIRQLHDELRKPGTVRFGCGGPGMSFTRGKDGWIKANGFIICHIDDLERDDWTVTRSKSDPRS